MKIVFICAMSFLVVMCATMVYSLMAMDKPKKKRKKKDLDEILEEVKRINRKHP